MHNGFYLKLALSNIRKHRKIYYPYLFTSILTVMMLYIIASLSRNEHLGSATLQFTITLGVWVTTLFTIIFLFYTNSFLMKRRKKEFGLLNILGMEKKHISRVVCYETLIILALSLMLGFGFGILLDKLLYLALQKLLGVPLEISFYISSYGIVFASIVVSLTFLLILVNSLRQIHLSKPIELLRGGQVGEKEPKAKWLLALLGLILLGGGYYISISVTNAIASLLMFFVAVVLVILGTYLLFTAGSISLLKGLRKNKRFYYQPTHFINVSGMIYRMKQNAVGLANISILCTMVLVIVFSTLSLWIGIDDVLQLRCPTDMAVTVHDRADSGQVLELIQSIAQDQGQTVEHAQSYNYLSFAGYRHGDGFLTNPELDEVDLMGNDTTSLFVITAEDFDRLTGGSHTLEDNEILLAARDDFYRDDTLRIFGDTYNVIDRFSFDVIRNDVAAYTAYATLWMVVKDQAAMDRLDALQKEAYGKHASQQRYYISFDLSRPSEEAVNAYADQLRQELKSREIGFSSLDTKPQVSLDLRELYGGLLFVGLFLGSLFIMAMILIIYYKQISEGYDDKERFSIMQKVGLSQTEIKRTIGAQILMVFFLPLMTAGLHTAFSFPSITHMFSALGMVNIPLMLWCLLGSFLLFAILYGIVYLMTARVYYKTLSTR